jgi:hypothetical protein
MRDLPLEQKKIARFLSGVLRLANALDTCSNGEIQRLRFEQKNGGLTLAATGYNPWARSAETIAAGSHLLQLALGKPILVKPLASRRARGATAKAATRNGGSGTVRAHSAATIGVRKAS